MIYPSKEFLKVFKETNGALSVCESICIMNIASEAPTEGVYIELGTFEGKSAMSASATFWDFIMSSMNPFLKFYLVDPIFKDKSEDELGIILDKVLAVSLNKVQPIFIGDISINVIPNYNNYAYVFIDSGSHQDGLPMQEVKLLEDRIVKDGIIAFHDYQSQFKEVEEAYDYLISTGKYSPININWPEIIQYVKDNDLERNNSSWHHPELDYPCFVGAVKKIL